MTAADIRAIRESARLSQSQLARRLRVSVSTVQSWEQGLRRPGGPAVLMLETIRDTLGGVPLKRRKS